MGFQPDLFRPPDAEAMTREKGDLGEDIGKRYLRESGLVNAMYQPEDISSAHPFDLIIDLIKGEQILADIKTYASRTVYRDTGINREHKEIYLAKQRQFGKKFFLIFVDELEGAIYGGYLDDLLAPYGTDSRRDPPRGRPFTAYPLDEKCYNGWKTYFSLDSMTHLAWLSSKNIKILKALSTSKYRDIRGT